MAPETGLNITSIASSISGLTGTVTTLGVALIAVVVATAGVRLAVRMVRGV